MNQLKIAEERMAAAAGLSDVLAAAYAAFMTMLPVIEDQQDAGGPQFDMFVMAGAMAAPARLVLLAAPSLPSASRSAAFAVTGPCAASAAELAAGLARLCEAVARRLYDTALTNAGAADRHACSKASHHARELSEWFSGKPAP